jgi:hypothetical protein
VANAAHAVNSPGARRIVRTVQAAPLERAWYGSRMGAAIWNILLGAVMLIGGLSGKLSLIGTHSSPLLAVVGAVILGYGVWQMVRLKRRP